MLIGWLSFVKSHPVLNSGKLLDRGSGGKGVAISANLPKTAISEHKGYQLKMEPSGILGCTVQYFAIGPCSAPAVILRLLQHFVHALQHVDDDVFLADCSPPEDADIAFWSSPGCCTTLIKGCLDTVQVVQDAISFCGALGVAVSSLQAICCCFKLAGVQLELGTVDQRFQGVTGAKLRHLPGITVAALTAHGQNSDRGQHAQHKRTDPNASPPWHLREYRHCLHSTAAPNRGVSRF